MINLDAVLPDIEQAVADRVESTTLSRLDEGQLRDLVYQLVERQHTGHLDQSEHFSTLVNLAAERHADMRAALDHSVGIRTGILTQLLSVLGPALPSLLGPIVVETVHRPDDHDKHTRHRMLRGFELLNGEKDGPAGRGTLVRSGQSWWIVALVGDVTATEIDARYAVVRHSGCRHEHSGCPPDCKTDAGVTHSKIELVTTDEAAKQIRDNRFEKLLRRISGRLVSLCGKKVSNATTGIWTVAQELEDALKTIKASQ